MPHFNLCPFCGAKIVARLFDEVSDEGDEDTEGKYVLIHGETKNLCPIEHYDGDFLGILIFDSPEEAAATWNTRCYVNNA